MIRPHTRNKMHFFFLHTQSETFMTPKAFFIWITADVLCARVLCTQCQLKGCHLGWDVDSQHEERNRGVSGLSDCPHTGYQHCLIWTGQLIFPVFPHISQYSQWKCWDRFCHSSVGPATVAGLQTSNALTWVCCHVKKSKWVHVLTSPVPLLISLYRKSRPLSSGVGWKSQNSSGVCWSDLQEPEPSCSSHEKGTAQSPEHCSHLQVILKWNYNLFVLVLC